MSLSQKVTLPELSGRQVCVEFGSEVLEELDLEVVRRGPSRIALFVMKTCDLFHAKSLRKRTQWKG
jgi:hypothetical protein